MNDADRIFAEIKKEAAAAGIPYSLNIHPGVRLNTRARTILGSCRGNERTGFVISVSQRLLSAPEIALRQTLAHELIHTCKGCSNHGAVFKGYAARMNNLFGYDISRTTDPEKYGISTEMPERYRLMCQSCGRVIRRSRKSRLVQHPEYYLCTCGGRLKRIQ